MAVAASETASSNTQPLTWSNALHSLEQSSPSPTLSSFLTDHLAQLRDPANPFPSADSTNVSKALTTTKPGGQLTKSQESAATEVGERFKVAKTTAEAAVKTCTRRSRQEDGRMSEDEWESVTAWIFEERMSIIGTVTLLLRIHDDEGHPCYSIAAELIPSILTSTFPSTILTSLVDRTQQQLPTPVRRSSTLAKYWTTQLVLEQKALLELLFLVYYSPTFQLEGPHVVQVFETVLKAKWGSQQELMGYMDQETQLVAQELAHLYSILAIEVLNLEVVMEQSDSPYPIPAPGETPLPTSSPFHPSHLASLSSTVESLVQLIPEQASPILLGWAFVTSKITSSLLERGVPNEYHDFAKASLKVETGSGGPNSQQPLFQLYTSHSLSTSSNLFPTLLSMLKSSLFGYSRASDSYSSSASSDPNTIGYLSVIRGLLLTLPHLVRLPFLNESQLSGLFETFSAVYSNPSSTILCAQFWQNLELEQASADSSMLLEEDRSAQNEAEKEIVELARSRFPVQFGPFIRLVRSLTAGLVSLTSSTQSHVTDDEELASTCSRTAFAYLASLPTLTHILPSTTPSPYESLSYPDPETGYSIRCTRAIQVSPSLSIKEGTMGRLVSPPGRKPLVVSWDVVSGWSAWQLIGDLVIDFAGFGSGRKKGNDVFGNGAGGEGDHPVAWENDVEKENDLVDAMELLKLVLKGDPSLGSTILDHLSSTSTNSSRPDLIEALFKILDRSLSISSIPTRLVSSLIELIAALLPSFPGVVWTFLRGSPQLFSSSAGSKFGSRVQGGSSYTNILSSEKIAGRYPVTLSLLTLVHSLVLESQVASRVVSPEYSAIKQGVLVRALNWVKDEVWSAHLNWRYSGLGQKFELAKQMVDVYGLVVEEGELESGLEKGNFSAPVKVVTDTFLSNSSSAGVAQLAPLLSTFTFGSSSIETLHRAGTYHDALVLEDLVESTLRLTLQLLRLRSLVQGSTSSLLEKLLLSSNASVNLSLSSSFSPSASFARSSGSSSRPEILECLVSFVTSPLSSIIAVQAAKVVTLLTVLSATSISEDRTGLVPLLGGSDKARETVVALLSIVGDSTGLVEVHVAVWDLLSAVIESQTGLAMLVVTGSQHTALDLSLTTTSDKGKSKEQTQPSPLPRPTLGKPLAKTALDIVVEKLGSWRSSWENEPEVLASILRFLDYVWQHLADYAESIDELRKNQELWKGLVEIAFEEAGAEPIEGDEVEPYCHRLMAKSHALRAIVLDTEYAIDKLGPKAQDTASFSTFAVSFKDTKKLLAALTAAIDSSCDPDLHQDVNELIRTSFPDLDLTSLRLPPSAHPLDRSRTFGTSYIYSLPLLRRHLDGHLAQENDGEQSMIGHEAFSEIVEQTARLNCNFSLLEAQMLGTTSWRQALETLSPLVRKDVAVQSAIAGCVTDIAKQVAQEDRGGQVMQTLHGERLEILLSLVEILHNSSGPETKPTSIALIGEVSSIFGNPSLDLIDSLSRKTKPSFHSALLQIAFFLSAQINSSFSNPSSLQSLSHDDKTQLNTQVASVLRILLSSLRELFLLARASKTFETEQDLSLSIALLSRLLDSPFAPPPPLWLAQCHSLDLFRTALNVFVSTNTFESDQPLYAPLILDFCLLVANSSPQAAEQIALDGVMTALTNNALTEAAESGAIAITSPVDGSQTTQHRLWTSMLALVVSLVSALGDSTRFIEQDVTGFARLYGSQIARAQSWSSDSPITAVGLEELSLVVALLQGMAKSSSRGGSSSLSTSVTAAFVEQTLHLLQHLVYALLHPNHLSSLIEGTTPEERNSIEKETNESSPKSISEAVNLAILRLAQNIVGTLIDFTDAWSMLTREATEWRSENAIILPTATVTANEKTSIGTILDLISHCTDLLRANSTSTSSSPSASSVFPTLPSPSPSTSRAAASDTLEGCLLLATTQLGLYGMIGSGPQQGQRGASFSRTLTELSTELVESIDKATAAEGGKGDSGRLLALLKARLASWS